MPMPPFSIDRIIPPFVGPTPAGSSDLMSPYEVTVSEVIKHFSTTSERRAILAGWLQYRHALRAIGARRGFQWLDGSFVEDKTTPPNDLDIVVFFHRPSSNKTNIAFASVWKANMALFDRSNVKANYHLDLFPIDLDGNSEAIVGAARYFLQLFSHQRATSAWIGMLQVRNEEAADEAALLASLIAPVAGVTP